MPVGFEPGCMHDDSHLHILGGDQRNCFFIQEIDAENPVLIAVGDRRPLRAERPLDPDDLPIRIAQRRSRSISER
jgi:hypothetical protein